MTAINSPASQAQTQSTLGTSYVFAQQRIMVEIAERLDLHAAGVIPLQGNLMGSGSDTVRIVRMGGVGFAEAFQTMSGETDPITASGFTIGYDEMTIARHGLSKEETYQGRILARPDTGVTLEMLEAVVPGSWIKTFRQKVAASGAGISASTGSTTAAWTFDDEIDHVTAYNETEGFEGGLVSIRHPEQYTDLRKSLRNEPSYKTPEAMAAFQSISPGGGFVDFMGVKNYASFDVTQASGAHQGFSFVPGAIGWVVASTTPVRTQNPATTMYMPDIGLVLERKGDGTQATASFVANLWFGVGRADPTLFPQRRILSIDD